MTGTTWSTVTSGNTFTIEARIPFTALSDGGSFPHSSPIPPVPGQTARMLLLLVDYDEETSDTPGAEVSLLFSAGKGTNIIGNSAAYNTVTFVLPPEPTDAGDRWTIF